MQTNRIDANFRWISNDNVKAVELLYADGGDAQQADFSRIARTPPDIFLTRVKHYRSSISMS